MPTSEPTLCPREARCVPLQREASTRFTRSRDRPVDARNCVARKRRSRHLWRGNTFHGQSPGDRPQAAGAFFFAVKGQRPVNGFRTWLNAHVSWTMPEQLFEPVLPGQPPLSRWTAEIESVLNPLSCAKV